MTRQSPVDEALLTNKSIYRYGNAFTTEAVLGIGFVRKADRPDGYEEGQPHYSALWCLRGQGMYDDGTIQVEVGPGMVVQRFPGHPHRLDITGGDWAECWIALGTSIFPALCAFRVVDTKSPVLSVPLDRVLLREINAACDALRDASELDLPTHVARAVSLLVELLGRSTDHRSRPGLGMMETACRRLDAEPRLSAHRLARDCGMSYERFRKVFREAVGMAPREYQILRRLNRAHVLLTTTDLSVKAIADELGYANPFIFSSQFKRYMGNPPSTFRQG